MSVAGEWMVCQRNGVLFFQVTKPRRKYRVSPCFIKGFKGLFYFWRHILLLNGAFSTCATFAFILATKMGELIVADILTSGAALLRAQRAKIIALGGAVWWHCAADDGLVEAG